MKYMKTADYVDIDRFMGDWYVIAARPTMFESGAHNSLERYSWNKDKERVDIDFSYRKNSFEGELKKIPQKGWIHNSKTNAHWKVQPLWPFKLDYLVVALDPEYQWTVIGVPNQKYLWLMARDWNFSRDQATAILEEVKRSGYDTKNVRFVPQKW